MQPRNILCGYFYHALAVRTQELPNGHQMKEFHGRNIKNSRSHAMITGELKKIIPELEMLSHKIHSFYLKRVELRKFRAIYYF